MLDRRLWWSDFDEATLIGSILQLAIEPVCARPVVPARHLHAATVMLPCERFGGGRLKGELMRARSVRVHPNKRLKLAARVD